jgi:hypothetical protein
VLFGNRRVGEAMSATVAESHRVTPTRVSLASRLGDDIDGGWWPHTSSVGRELPHLTDALKADLGPIVDIGVNWSSLAGMPNLDAMDWRGNSLMSIREAQRQRVISLTGARATTRLLLVPPRTSTALAVMLLRRAARLPILPAHRDSRAFRIADEIVRSVCCEKAPDGAPITSA